VALIIIVGPKHSGKSGAGKALARLWEEQGGSAAFVDLDELVESRTGQSPRLLYRAGPEIFRRAEAEALRSLFEGDPPGEGSFTVVAAGGGLADNREALDFLRNRPAANRTGAVYVAAVEVPPETAWERIGAAAEQSGELPPFLDTEDPRRTHRLIHERRGRLYRELAAVTVQGGDTPEETAARLLERLGLRRGEQFCPRSPDSPMGVIPKETPPKSDS
jgi:shikimate kinase